MKSKRILSIDIFRGLTIFAMVFVNDLAGVVNIPPWMKHMPADADAMTFVDVVFPAFLFIVGMAIPFAVKTRLKRGDSWLQIWQHALVRIAGLLILGVFMVNSEEMNAEANLISKSLWDVLLFISAILIWNQYPKTDQKSRKNLFLALKVVGGITLGVLFFLFRKGTAPNLQGMTTSWWGILGLIGWAYFYALLVYSLFKQNLAGIIGILTLFIFMACGLKSETLELPVYLQWMQSQTGHLVHASLSLAGIVLSLFLMDDPAKQTPGRKIRSMLIFGLLLAVAAYFLRPLYGISKIYATPSWALYCASICSMLFAFIYWLVDVKRLSRWANFLEPAGKNPLLTYILPYIFYAIAGFSYLPAMFNTGALGIARSIVFSLFILGISAILTKRGIKLHL